MGIFFGVVKISKIFGGMPDILYIFGGYIVNTGSKPRKN